MSDDNAFIMKGKEKEKAKIVKYMGWAFLPFIRGRDPFSEVTSTRSTLIPRMISPGVSVFILTIDIFRELQEHQSNQTIYHNANNGNGDSDTINDMVLHKIAYNGDIVGAQEALPRNMHFLWHFDSQGNLPLHIAVERGHKEVAKCLINNYPQGSYAINRFTEICPLYLAVHNHHKDLVEYMLHVTAKDDQLIHNLVKGKSIVRAAIDTRNQEIAKVILKCQPELIRTTDEEGWTPLSYAAFKGLNDTVGFILKKSKKSVSTPNKDNSYPIHKACLGGHVRVLEMFHSHYPSTFNKRDPDGRTILHLAAKERLNNLKNVVSYLLSINEGRELINKKDENGCTPSDLARSSKNYEVLQLNWV